MQRGWEKMVKKKKYQSMTSGRLLRIRKKWKILKFISWDFLGDPVVKTSPSNAGGAGLIPGWRVKIPYASQPNNQNTKQEQHYKRFN